MYETEQRLERGELVLFARAPFALPVGEDLAALLRQSPCDHRRRIGFDPRTGRLSGLAPRGPEETARFGQVFERFSREVRGWLGAFVPGYDGGIEPDRVSFRPLEEATCRARRNARKDLLHIDAFPGRPARGRRILRVFANVHPLEARVWAVSEPLPRLLERFASEVPRSRAGWFHELGARLLDRFRRPDRRHDDADVFLLRLHDYLKRNVEFQLRGPRRLWKMPPGSAWAAMTDACCYADLRGKALLEHSFFVAPEVLKRPELAPARLVA